MADNIESTAFPVPSTSAVSCVKGKSGMPSRTLKRCPECSMECPIAVKRCRNGDCQHEFKAKEKNWEKVKQRGVISPTHEREKLEYRADCLHNGCDYNVVVLYHHKHAKGNSIFPYTTPGKAFDFLGDGTEDHPPSEEGRLFLQMFSQYFLGHPNGLPKWTHQKKGAKKSTQPSRKGKAHSAPLSSQTDSTVSTAYSSQSDTTASAADSCQTGCTGLAPLLSQICTGETSSVPLFSQTGTAVSASHPPQTEKTSSPTPSSQTGKESSAASSSQTVKTSSASSSSRTVKTSSAASSSQQVKTSSSASCYQQVKTSSAASSSQTGKTSSAASSRTVKTSSAASSSQTGKTSSAASSSRTVKTSSAASSSQQGKTSSGEPSSQTGKISPEAPSSQTGPTVVLFREGSVDVAVGYLHPGRRTLHGKTVPPGFEVVQLTWVKAGEVTAPLVLGDAEENQLLTPGLFFALPRAQLVKVKLIR